MGSQGIPASETFAAHFTREFLAYSALVFQVSRQRFHILVHLGTTIWTGQISGYSTVGFRFYNKTQIQRYKEFKNFNSVSRKKGNKKLVKPVYKKFHQ